MLKHRKQVRSLLNEAPLESFWDIVHRAKISDDDQVIIDLRFVHGWPISKIAQEKHMSEESINKIIQKIYDKIAHMI